MDSRSPLPLALSLAEQIAAAQDWWREAGVDLTFTDEPHGWLAEPAGEEEQAPAPAPVAAKPPPPPRPAIGGDPEGWPQDLTGFQRWWLEEPSLDHGGTHPRLVPRGPQGASLAILVPMPEAGDTDTLLSGSEGKLLASLALALGLAPDELYFAAVLPRHMAAPDWAGMAAAGLGKVLLHHLSLAAPKRLLVLGRDVLPLLGHDPAQAAPAVHELAIQGGQLPLLASYQPARLLQRAQWRASLWQRLLDWTDGDMRR